LGLTERVELGFLTSDAPYQSSHRGCLKDVQGSHALVSVGYSIRRDNFLRDLFDRRNESWTK
jgi:hypothetical protein